MFLQPIQPTNLLQFPSFNGKTSPPNITSTPHLMSTHILAFILHESHAMLATIRNEDGLNVHHVVEMQLNGAGGGEDLALVRTGRFKSLVASFLSVQAYSSTHSSSPLAIRIQIFTTQDRSGTITSKHPTTRHSLLRSI